MNKPPPPPPSKFLGCVKCKRLMPESKTVCDHCGAYQLRRRPDPIREALIELVAATTAGSSADGSGFQTERIDSAMQQAEHALKDAPDHAALMRMAAEPPWTCTQHLEFARDAMDSADTELQAAFKTASGLACLLLLDMIMSLGTMAARTRAIIAATKDAVGEQP